MPALDIYKLCLLCRAWIKPMDTTSGQVFKSGVCYDSTLWLGPEQASAKILIQYLNPQNDQTRLIQLSAFNNLLFSTCCFKSSLRVQISLAFCFTIAVLGTLLFSHCWADSDQWSLLTSPYSLAFTSFDAPIALVNHKMTRQSLSSLVLSTTCSFKSSLRVQISLAWLCFALPSLC